MAIWTLPALGSGHPRLTGAQPSHLLTVVPHGSPGVTAAGGAAAPAVSDDATEVPEAGLTAVTLEAPNTRAAGALTRGWVTGATVGAMWVAVAGTGAASQAYTPGRRGVVLAAAVGSLGAVWGGRGGQRGQGGAAAGALSRDIQCSLRLAPGLLQLALGAVSDPV